MEIKHDLIELEERDLSTRDAEGYAAVVWSDYAQAAIWNGKEWVLVQEFRDLGPRQTWWGWNVCV